MDELSNKDKEDAEDRALILTNPKNGNGPNQFHFGIC